jgi:hypothetical protein
MRGGSKSTLVCGYLSPFERLYGTVDTGGKSILSFLFYFPRYRPPFGECVCDLYLFSVSRYELCVCGNLCVCVRMSAIWSRHQPWEILRCDWAPMSNRFYLI